MFEAPRLNLSSGPAAELAQDQKSECAGREARGQGGLGALMSELVLVAVASCLIGIWAVASVLYFLL